MDLVIVSNPDDVTGEQVEDHIDIIGPTGDAGDSFDTFDATVCNVTVLKLI